MKRTFGLLGIAGVAVLAIASGCDGPRVGEALDPTGGSAGVANAGSSPGGQSRGGTTAGNGGSAGGAQAGGSSAGGSGGTLGGEGGEAGTAGTAGSGACTGDGTSTRGPALVCIPGGTFNMGTEVLMGLIAAPIHAETVESFYMDATEVTLGQYLECMADAPESCTPPNDYNVNFEIFCYFPDTARSQYPVNCLDWGQAKAFCEWAGKRLPTEVEWEYSVRSPSNRTYPWGNEPPMEQLCWSPTGGMLCPVGSYPEGDSAEGLSDLGGNVWEMTASYNCTYSEQGVGPPCDETRVVRRGGGYTTNAIYGVSGGFREQLWPTERRPDVGFRCAR